MAFKLSKNCQIVLPVLILLLVRTRSILSRSWNDFILSLFFNHEIWKTCKETLVNNIEEIPIGNIKQNRNLDFNPEFSSQFRMFFHRKNLKSENNNPWFKPYQSIVCASVDRQCLEYLGYITLIKFWITEENRTSMNSRNIIAVLTRSLTRVPLNYLSWIHIL